MLSRNGLEGSGAGYLLCLAGKPFCVGMSNGTSTICNAGPRSLLAMHLIETVFEHTVLPLAGRLLDLYDSHRRSRRASRQRPGPSDACVSDAARFSHQLDGKPYTGNMYMQAGRTAMTNEIGNHCAERRSQLRPKQIKGINTNAVPCLEQAICMISPFAAIIASGGGFRLRNCPNSWITYTP